MTAPASAAAEVVSKGTVLKACAYLRDKITEAGVGPRVYPLAFDIIASTPTLANALAGQINILLKDQEQ